MMRAMATDVFNSKYLAIQAQKKILGKMASKSIATTLVDDTSSEVLDELYRVTKEYTQSKKEAEKIIKNLIKIIIKLAILYRNNQFNQDEIALMEKFKKKVHQLAMTVVSFYQVDFTFDRNVLSKLLNECRDMLHQIIQRHLTAKSHGRVNNVFDHFSDCEFLAALYNPFGSYKSHLEKLCEGVNKMLDEDNI
ncbi:tumor necrosis factor alpha-induced protein 8 isoform X3 [Rhinatrema bivittatum]|uniref:tumor necrosis factor alpha-induced protein 8 isoform X3 n=2 Tax=Rhinatrema bivittatum TaxID=194408 RepID=UPI00112A70A6|nr:tumor necrosis factor alpha-induced protein 8 isoform X3 [Rhinatrema bivittatum]